MGVVKASFACTMIRLIAVRMQWVQFKCDASVSVMRVWYGGW